ncbi:hypothetical protein AVEN_221548-1 [Araneus ventricosus]|uniref:Uncharacterized protein n=1 Tax=Araneus ventricosus TaxID=182803 RepID=A0A4Y2RI73_ARAVE|nr:hypothetical protein AVEN_221548-1 [Araneus ventricosus]
MYWRELMPFRVISVKRNGLGFFTDGGKSVWPESYKGLRGRIKIVALRNLEPLLHPQTKFIQALPDSLKEILNQSVKVVNFIKANSPNTRLFNPCVET